MLLMLLLLPRLPFRNKGSHICPKHWHVLPFEAHHQLGCLRHHTHIGFYPLPAWSRHTLGQKWSSICVAICQDKCKSAECSRGLWADAVDLTDMLEWKRQTIMFKIHFQ